MVLDKELEDAVGLLYRFVELEVAKQFEPIKVLAIGDDVSFDNVLSVITDSFKTQPLVGYTNGDYVRWIKATVNMFHRDMTREEIKLVSRMILSQYQRGYVASSKVEALAERMDITTNRLNMIIENQASNLRAAIFKRAMLERREYFAIWDAQEDALTRPLHRKLNNSVFDVRYGVPGEGLPGEPINCRCKARRLYDKDRGSFRSSISVVRDF